MRGEGRKEQDREVKGRKRWKMKRNEKRYYSLKEYKLKFGIKNN